MKKKLKRSPIAGLIICSLLSGGAVSHCSVDRNDGSLKKALIWRISGKDLPAPSFLFGTVHLLDSSDQKIHYTIIEQLKGADALVFETNLADPQYPQLALQQALMETDSLDAILSGDQLRALKSFFWDEFNFPLEAVNRMKPFYIASLMGALDEKGNSKSHEEILMQIAREEGKVISGISTLEAESKIIDAIEIKDQIAYLFKEMEAYQRGDSDSLKQEIMNAYEKADMERIHALISESLEDFPAVYDQLFSSRNLSWLPSMVQLMQDQSCFFAVGVGHLPGESGLIRLLRKKGYKVSPVHMDFWFHDR